MKKEVFALKNTNKYRCRDSSKELTRIRSTNGIPNVQMNGLSYENQQLKNNAVFGGLLFNDKITYCLSEVESDIERMVINNGKPYEYNE
jgi:hypothetical protein